MKIVIIGAGPAGVTVAETLRALHSAPAEIIMLSAEPYPPYAPPAMVDHFLTGSNVHFWRGADWPARFDIDYRPGLSVVAVEADAHRIHLADGSALYYDRLVIAAGGRLYAPLPGLDLPQVYNFKSLSAAEALIARVRSGQVQRAIVVGAGFIGMEIALLLRALNVAVIQLEMLPQVMAAMLDSQAAAVALSILRQRGVDVRLNTKAAAFLEGGVLLESGELLAGDVFIAATGVRPNLSFLEGSGIDCGWGVRVDDHLRASAPDVYAAGDVVETPDLLTGETYVHAIFPNAVEQGRVVGLNLAGYNRAYAGAERMNSLKHLGLPIIAVGLKEGDEILLDRRDGRYRCIYLRHHRIVGFQLVGDIRPAGLLRSLMLSGEDVRPYQHRLLDPYFGQGMRFWQAMSL